MFRRLSQLPSRVQSARRLASAIPVFEPEHKKSWAEQKTNECWAKEFDDATHKITSNCSFDDSAAQLRELTKKQLIRGVDIQDNPERFFEAHRILAKRTVGFFLYCVNITKDKGRSTPNSPLSMYAPPLLYIGFIYLKILNCMSKRQ